MLLGEQGGRNQHSDLLAIACGDEGSAHGHLGLAEANVTAHEPIHDTLGGHVGDHRVNCRSLVRGLLEGKACGELLVLEGGQLEAEALAGLATCVDIQQLRGHITGLFGGLAPGFFPLVRAQLVQRGEFRIAASVAADQV